MKNDDLMNVNIWKCSDIMIFTKQMFHHFRLIFTDFYYFLKLILNVLIYNFFSPPGCNKTFSFFVLASSYPKGPNTLSYQKENVCLDEYVKNCELKTECIIAR